MCVRAAVQYDHVEDGMSSDANTADFAPAGVKPRVGCRPHGQQQGYYLGDNRGRAPQRQPRGVCNLCEEPGHYMRECPHAEAFQEFLQQQRGGSAAADRQPVNLPLMRA